MVQWEPRSRIKIPSSPPLLSISFFQLSFLTACTCDHVLNMLCDIYYLLSLYYLIRLFTLYLTSMYTHISTYLHTCPVLTISFLFIFSVYILTSLFCLGTPNSTIFSVEIHSHYWLLRLHTKCEEQLEWKSNGSKALQDPRKSLHYVL